MARDVVAETGTGTASGGASRGDRPSWGDELRNALAFSVLAGVYALMFGGLFHLVPPAPLALILRSFGAGYGLAAVLFVAAHAVAWTVLRPLSPERRAALLPLSAPLASLVACAGAVPRLFRPSDLADLVGTAAFLGAGLALSTAHEFYVRFQRQLVPGRRVRDLLASRPALGDWLRRSILPLLIFGRLVPWVAGGIALLAFPPALRAHVTSYLIVLTLLAHLLNRKLLEELAVWVFLHSLRAGDYLAAARLPIRPSRLSVEIEAAPPDLEAPFARFIAYGMQGPEGLALTPEGLGHLVRVHLTAYGLTAMGQSSGGGTDNCKLQIDNCQFAIDRSDPWPVTADHSLVRRLLERGVRFHVDSEPSNALEPLPLPHWPQLLRGEGRALLAALYPDEPLWQVVGRLYETPIRGLLLLPSLLWLPLLGVTLAFVGRGPWALPMVGAAFSCALLFWLTLFYGNWIFDHSLRRHDFEFLARQLGSGKMRGELEDALGAREPLVRDRAVELLLFNDSIARLGITVPPAGLRKFLKRAE